ncbi:MAG: lamin tail domain-containing protein, partial [Deltaproteobacteria bacterium]|nr:lamin tail domain-containing protein [Deltaproteobacteria bacterium]
MRNSVKAACMMMIFWVACGTDEGPKPPPDEPIVMNEVDVHGRDWVELVNTGTSGIIDLSGWTLTDDPGKESHLYVIPPGTEVGPGERIVIKGEKVKGDGTGFTFGIKSGETVRLMAPGGGAQLTVAIKDVPDGFTWGRYPDSTGGWQLTLP